MTEVKLQSARSNQQAMQYLQTQQQQLQAIQQQIQVIHKSGCLFIYCSRPPSISDIHMLFVFSSLLSLCSILIIIISIIHFVQGSNSPWNIGFAYRIPDTNINVNCNYQQGRGNVQISCVPDEAMSLLGPNGE